MKLINNKNAPDRKPYFALFIIFLKASTFTFAGGLAALPAIQRDVVDKYKLMEKEQFLEYAALSQTLPGVIAINCATLVGRKTAGTLGMLAAGLGAIIPAFALMVAATILASLIPSEGPLLGAMRGIRAASAALILAAAFSVGGHCVKGVFAVLVMIAAFAFIVVLNLSAPVVVLLAGFAGYLYHKLKRRRAGTDLKNIKDKEDK